MVAAWASGTERGSRADPRASRCERFGQGGEHHEGETGEHTDQHHEPDPTGGLIIHHLDGCGASDGHERSGREGGVADDVKP